MRVLVISGSKKRSLFKRCLPLSFFFFLSVRKTDDSLDCLMGRMNGKNSRNREKMKGERKGPLETKKERKPEEECRMRKEERGTGFEGILFAEPESHRANQNNRASLTAALLCFLMSNAVFALCAMASFALQLNTRI